jgi:serine/threonine protein kinase
MTSALPPPELLIGGVYAITSSDGERPGVLGEGSFGAVYKGMDVSLRAAVAIKLEAITAKYPQLAYEHKVLEELKGTPGIPRVLFYGPYEKTHNALVMERLGASVGSTAPLDTLVVANVARGVLDILRMVHTAGIVHRDIKPENILWPKGGAGPVNLRTAQVHLIDFGLCKRVIAEDGRHIPQRTDKALVGTPEFASLGAHTGCELSRRDDIESLVYVLVYLSSKTLPWDRVVSDEGDDRYGKMRDVKRYTLQDVDYRLLRQLPSALKSALRATLIYARTTLQFQDMPNYDLLGTFWSMPSLLPSAGGAS